MKNSKVLTNKESFVFQYRIWKCANIWWYYMVDVSKVSKNIVWLELLFPRFREKKPTTQVPVRYFTDV